MASTPSGWTDTAEKNVLDVWFRNVARSVGSHLGLLTTMPTADDGTGAAEVTAGNYARVAWAGTTGKWKAASTSTGGAAVISNNGAVSFTTCATAAWATGTDAIVGWAWYDAATAGTGNIKAFGALTTSRTVGIGDKPSFADGALKFYLGNASAADTVD